MKILYCIHWLEGQYHEKLFAQTEYDLLEHNRDYVVGINNIHKTGYDVLILIHIGQRIHDIPKFEKSLGSFDIAGHLIHKDISFYLHPQIVCINLHTVKLVDLSPDNEMYNSFEIERSVESIHHGYTPLWIKGTDTPTVYKNEHWGQRLLYENIHLKIVNLDEARDYKSHAYSEFDTERFFKALDDNRFKEPLHHSQMEFIINYLKHWRNIQKYVYKFNTEPVWEEPLPSPIDKIITVSSGLKVEKAIYESQWSGDILYFDISEPGLEHKSKCISGEYRYEKESYNLWLDYVRDNCTVKYLHIDIIQDIDKFITTITDNSLVNVSNIFGYRSCRLYHGDDKLKKVKEQLFEFLRTLDNIFISQGLDIEKVKPK